MTDKAKTLMVQGTGSGVGKSVITAGLCRRFYRDGRRVAPFKAQNMSLNSFVTPEGGELGRAQAYQAEACGIPPHVAMNPVLLKPSADNLSQVIVMGKVAETRNARDYYAGRGKYVEEVRSAFDYLSKTYEIVVLEGAGSPAEINLRDFDFVNMPMAKMAAAPVLIVGDIDRGGVFAWMKGTYDLLTADEKQRVGGFVINKFRGDIDLLKPGIAMFEDMVGKPVLGVIPFYLDLFVDEEDAIPSWSNRSPQDACPALLDVAVLRLPRISNFTDVSPLVRDPSVSVRYVWHPSQIKDPDLIVIPGSKNTIDDLEFMRAQGLSEAVADRYRSGSVLLGICGGFQILGKRVRDPDHLESRESEISGLGLLDMETTLLPEKVTRQVRRPTRASPIFPEGFEIEGYEIHMGNSRFESPYIPLFRGEPCDDEMSLGLTDEGGNIVGAYIHGFLDNDGLRGQFLRHVRAKRGIPEPATAFDYRAFREKQLDRLGDLVGDNLDMGRIYDLLENKTGEIE
ncbi:MAG: cobyric acid synthase [Nitrospinae bacterium]|nr:cobyric acid synthase [Nitrospinota bacterium]